MAEVKCPNCKKPGASKKMHKLHYTYLKQSMIVYLEGIQCLTCQKLSLTKKEAEFFEKSQKKMVEYMNQEVGE